MPTLVFFLVLLRILKMTFKIEMIKKKIAFIQKNEKTCNFWGFGCFVYYKCF